MERNVYPLLKAWKESLPRKPLILRGARQTGKTYILKAFGAGEFPAFHHFDFEKAGPDLRALFDRTLDPRQIIQNLALYQGHPIGENDLILFDEIQACPRALTSLKYFCEELPGQAICAAGSLLGVAVSESAWPVGKVTYLDLHPLCFEEFLANSGQEMLFSAYESSWNEKTSSPVLHAKLWEALTWYYVTGGMPEAVAAFFRHGERISEGFFAARNVQKELIRSFLQDFTKHSGAIHAAHIASVFEDIPRQLSGYTDTSVKRYRFKDVIPGKKGLAELDGPIGWLEKAGLIHKTLLCERPELPLQSFCKSNLFKLFLCDIGLLGAALDLAPALLLRQDYGIVKGFFAENFVAAEWIAAGSSGLYSWIHRTSEVEFLLEHEGSVIPVEVKSGLRTRAQSLNQYILRYAPPYAVKISGLPLALHGGPLLHIPLYYAGKLARPTAAAHLFSKEVS